MRVLDAPRRCGPFYGPGRLAGTLYFGQPPVAGRGRVLVFDDVSGLLVWTVWSDQDTGAWSVSGLALDRLWLVVGTDPTGVQTAAVHDRRQAELPT